MEEKNIELKDLNEIGCGYDSSLKQDIILNSSAYLFRNVSGYKFN